MKMVQGAGTIADYGNYVYNCTLGQWNYKIPIESLTDIQLYADASSIGSLELIWTCSAGQGTVESISPAASVVGTDPVTGNPYVLIQGISGSTTASCFVIGMSSGGNMYFSQEYCIESVCAAQGLGLVDGCYGNLDPLISVDREGIYFGEGGGIAYKHTFRMRNTEVTLNAIRNDFKSGRTRNFRTESVDIFKFWGDAIPEWYMPHVDAVFKRGEVFIYDNTKGVTTKYIVESTAYEKADECVKLWKPFVLLRANQYQSFSCEPDPCAVVQVDSGGVPLPACCDPAVTGATVEFLEGNTVTLNFTPCEPTPGNGYIILYRVVGSGGGYTNAGSFASSPAVFGTGGSDGDQYEGFIYSDCDGVFGDMIPWTTGEAAAFTISSSPCALGQVVYTVTGNPGDIITVRVSYTGLLKKLSGLFTRGYITVSAADGSPTNQTVTSPCYVDTADHPFSIFADVVVTLVGTSATITVVATVDNSANTASSYATITDANGDTMNLTSSGCSQSSATGGSSPC